ncbi:MFS transporter [Alkalihalophilus marmarensis]|uniref:MFS transporter n=1 Tax=Alkalihalophilus marmarensis TaxID=521377 RepID=UPI002DB8BE9A|nr:MFS transporter [Alkalihalophilus marmarensis]MEC2070984.1 MFS transporter [Alkalihalophilus marmarensis]
MTSTKVQQAVLFLLIFYFILADVILSPFYPQFFSKVFGVEDLEFTALYIFIARLTVVISVPIWGMLSKRFEVKHLIYTGQWTSAVMLLCMAISQHEIQFMIFTVLLLIGKSSLFLIYPLLIQLNEEKKRTRVVGMYHMVFHAAVITGTLTGAWIIALEQPLYLFIGLAAIELSLWFTAFVTLRYLNTHTTSPPKVKQGFTRKHGFILAGIGLILLLFHTANNMIRPYFTLYTMNEFQLSSFEGSLLFMMPSAMAILAFPFIQKGWSKHRAPLIFTVTLAVLAFTLIVQGLTDQLIWLWASRIVYGFCLIISQAALELTIFNRSTNHVQVYAAASTFQNAGLLIAPLAASSTAAAFTLASPLTGAGLVCVTAVIVALYTFNMSSQTEKNKAA